MTMEFNSRVVSATPTTHTLPIANFHPGVWGDRFLHLNTSQHSDMKNIEDEKLLKELIDEVKGELALIKPSIQLLQLIDSIQRLGVAYHFEFEIDDALQTVFDAYNNGRWKDYPDIYSVSLCFRLLRQHGHIISTKIFDKFKDGEGGFKASMIDDAHGMLELYEATHLRVHGEYILDECFEFTKKHLERMQSSLANSKDNIALAQQITHALKQSNRRGITRLEARQYMPIYEQTTSHNKTLLRLAMLDFNMLQSMHQQEVAEICRWWKGLDVPGKLPFARDRVVECFFWILGIYFEPKYAIARKILTKVISLTSIVDDIYDAYGTFEELQIFTTAIERWSIKCLDELPGSIKNCYQAILDVYEEIEVEMAKQETMYRLYYAKEAMKITVRAYFEESQWREENKIPTLEEYMSVATRSTAMRSLVITSFLGMSKVATEDHFQWTIQDPPVLKPVSIICRLMDDLIGNEFEQKREHVTSAVHCYMEEHSATKEEAITELKKQLEDAWKDLNEGLLRPTVIPSPLLHRMLNFARVMDVLYKEDDFYTHVGPKMQAYIAQILTHPILLD